VARFAPSPRARVRAREPSRALALIPRAREAKLVPEVAAVRSRASDENLGIDIFSCRMSRRAVWMKSRQKMARVQSFSCLS
jgi:hypothetical protein